MSGPAERPDPGAAVARIEEETRREAMAIHARADAEAEAANAVAIAQANAAIDRRIAGLRELRAELVEASARIEREMRRAAREIGRRADVTYPPGP